MSRLSDRMHFLAASLLATGLMSACGYTEYPPRIDMEFKPGAPVVSNSLEFVTDATAKSAFPAPEVAEQVAFLNATLREIHMSSVSPNTSSALNRRYSVFLGHRLFDTDLESALDRVRISSLVASAEWTEPPTEPARPHARRAGADCAPFNFNQAQIGECTAPAPAPAKPQAKPKTAAASCVPFKYDQAQINECPEGSGK